MVQNQLDEDDCFNGLDKKGKKLVTVIEALFKSGRSYSSSVTGKVSYILSLTDQVNEILYMKQFLIF